MTTKQDRIIDMQKALKIAREALEKIKYGHSRIESAKLAENALDEMWRLSAKQPMQALCGHERRKTP
jgi:hypothetical protein